MSVAPQHPSSLPRRAFRRGSKRSPAESRLRRSAEQVLLRRLRPWIQRSGPRHKPRSRSNPIVFEHSLYRSRLMHLHVFKLSLNLEISTNSISYHMQSRKGRLRTVAAIESAQKPGRMTEKSCAWFNICAAPVGFAVPAFPRRFPPSLRQHRDNICAQRPSAVTGLANSPHPAATLRPSPKCEQFIVENVCGKCELALINLKLRRSRWFVHNSDQTLFQNRRGDIRKDAPRLNLNRRATPRKCSGHAPRDVTAPAKTSPALLAPRAPTAPAKELRPPRAPHTPTAPAQTSRFTARHMANRMPDTIANSLEQTALSENGSPKAAARFARIALLYSPNQKPVLSKPLRFRSIRHD